MPRDNTRARRVGHQPRCLDDYSVKLWRPHPLQTHALPDQAVGGAISPSHVDALAPPAGQKQSSPLPEATSQTVGYPIQGFPSRISHPRR